MTWYHGTRRGFKKGGLLLPRAMHGGKGSLGHLVNPSDDESDWVYITTDRGLAEDFALLAPGRGKPKVLTVNPLDAPEPDPATFDGEDRESYRVKAARVIGVEDLRVAEVLARMMSNEED